MAERDEEEFFNQPLLTRRRRTNSDGSNNIACKKCGRIIASGARERMVTATCHECYTGGVEPKQVPVVQGMPRPDLIVESQDELLEAIWKGEHGAEVGTIERQVRRRWSPLDLVAGGFRALGFSQHKKAEPPKDVVYDTMDQETSKQVARRKQRIPIFGKKEEGQ